MSNTVRNSSYLFIDGGYFRRIFNDRLQIFLGTRVRIRWDLLRMRTNAVRIFYYDSIDNERRTNESDEDYEVRIAEQKGLMDEISAASGYFLRLGSVSGQAGKRRQKEVDVLLAVDMLTHSHNKNMETAMLIAGDRDFKPVVDALVQQGTLVKLISDKKSTSRELIQAADSAERLSLRALWSFTDGPNRQDANELFPWLLDLSAPLPNSPPALTGTMDGRHVSLWQDGSLWTASLPGSMETIFQKNWQFHDKEKLKSFLENDFGPIQWLT